MTKRGEYWQREGKFRTDLAALISVTVPFLSSRPERSGVEWRDLRFVQVCFYSRRMKHAVRLLLAIDLVGAALFAAEGASTGVQARLDLLGMLVLAFVTALGGGIVRDVLIGDVPPSSIRNWHYAAVALGSGAAVFLLH